MKERPILMNAAMVAATLDGCKTQTRRLMKPQPTRWCNGWQIPKVAATPEYNFEDSVIKHCPYGKPGDRLYVRETFALSVVDPDGPPPEDDPDNYDVIYRSDETAISGWTNGKGKPIKPPWKPSIHMPRWASRIDLEITKVRAERLMVIDERDCYAEGITDADARRYDAEEPTARGAFKVLWESINGAGSWDANPWVWVIEFKRIGKDLRA